MLNSSSLQANVAAASGGGSPISNPGVAYVQTNGNNGTAEIGNPAKPYSTGAVAWAALKAFHNSTSIQHSFNFGRGTWTIPMTAAEIEAGYNLFLAGVGRAATTITISNSAEAGENGADGAPNSVVTGNSGNNGGAAGSGSDGQTITVSLNVESNHSLTANFNLGAGSGGSGGNGGQGGSGFYDPGSESGGYGGNGGNGGNGGSLSGNLSLFAVTSTVSGGAGAGGGGGTGGYGGSAADGNGSDGVTGSDGEAGLDGIVDMLVVPKFCDLGGTATAAPGNYEEGTFYY